MEKEIILAGDWNDLTDEERCELEQKFAEGYERDVAHGLYDEYPDYNSPEEIAWEEYKIEEERFKWEAVSFYKKYLEYKGDKKPSPTLLSIFKYNVELLSFFLNRIKEGDLQGNEIICEFQAIMKLQEGCPKKLVDDRRKLEPLRVALSDMGFITKSKQNWSDGFNAKHSKKIDKIIGVYQVFIERNL